MINILSYVGMNMQSEVCLWTLLGLLRTIFDATLFKVNANLKQVWQMNMPQELSMPVQHALRTMISGIMLVQCFTVYVYLASYIVLLYPVFLEERPTLVLPWLLLAAIRNLLCELTSLALGLGTCVLLGPGKPLCIKFLIVKMAVIMPAFYMWILVYSYYHALKIASSFKTFPVVLPPCGRDYGLELAIRRRRTKSLLDEEQLREKIVAGLYAERANDAKSPLTKMSTTILKTKICTSDSKIHDNQLYVSQHLSTASDKYTDINAYEDWLGTETIIPRDSDRILEQFVVMLLRIAAYLKIAASGSVSPQMFNVDTNSMWSTRENIEAVDVTDTPPLVANSKGPTASYLREYPQIFMKKLSAEVAQPNVNQIQESNNIVSNISSQSISRESFKLRLEENYISIKNPLNMLPKQKELPSPKLSSIASKGMSLDNLKANNLTPKFIKKAPDKLISTNNKNQEDTDKSDSCNRSIHLQNSRQNKISLELLSQKSASTIMKTEFSEDQESNIIEVNPEEILEVIPTMIANPQNISNNNICDQENNLTPAVINKAPNKLIYTNNKNQKDTYENNSANICSSLSNSRQENLSLALLSQKSTITTTQTELINNEERKFIENNHDEVSEVTFASTVKSQSNIYTENSEQDNNQTPKFINKTYDKLISTDNKNQKDTQENNSTNIRIPLPDSKQEKLLESLELVPRGNTIRITKTELNENQESNVSRVSHAKLLEVTSASTVNSKTLIHNENTMQNNNLTPKFTSSDKLISSSNKNQEDICDNNSAYMNIHLQNSRHEKLSLALLSQSSAGIIMKSERSETKESKVVEFNQVKVAEDTSTPTVNSQTISHNES